MFMVCSYKVSNKVSKFLAYNLTMIVIKSLDQGLQFNYSGKFTMGFNMMIWQILIPPNLIKAKVHIHSHLYIKQ